jgi:AcrR family transcriptional regulator
VEESEQSAGDGLPRLPPGRHGLSRGFVTQNQRDRLAAGIIAAVAEHGYNATTISQIAAEAGVSRRTFYGFFSSKEECYFDTYGMIVDHVEEAMRNAGREEQRWPNRVRAELNALLGTFAANPDLARFSLMAPLSAGGEPIARYQHFLERMIAVLGEGRPESPKARNPSDAAESAMAAGIAAVVVSKVNSGDGERLMDLLPDMVELALTPYLGPMKAVAEARR